MNLFTSVFDLFFPPKCIYCGEFLALGDRPLICRRCLDLIPISQLRCGKCGGVITYNNGMPECLSCKTAGRYFDGVFAPATYNGNVRLAILKYKFSAQTYMAKPLSYFTAGGLKKLGVKADLVLSVPPDPKRRTKRGFDYTGQLAKYVASELKIPFRSDWLKKTKSTPAQSRLTKAERLKNIKGSFALTSKANVAGLSILLVDDIFTTGATTSEVSKLLKKKGAKYVFVATLAKR
ncbi:MAG: ComF family protein [Monoglobales bacterium]